MDDTEGRNDGKNTDVGIPLHRNCNIINYHLVFGKLEKNKFPWAQYTLGGLCCSPPNILSSWLLQSQRRCGSHVATTAGATAQTLNLFVNMAKVLFSISCHQI